jgi:hypothetical protein
MVTRIAADISHSAIPKPAVIHHPCFSVSTRTAVSSSTR